VESNIFNDSIVLLDKPVGMTSFDTISKFRRLVNIRKVGHSGTLDKFASGLLILGTGKATKLTRYFLESDKKYEALVLLGTETDTCDISGEVFSVKPVESITEEEIKGALNSFLSETSQMPPKYSALKVGGKRASDMARRGEEVSLKERTIKIYEIDSLFIDMDEGTVKFTISCSKGTYIRSIARDLGDKLGCGACLKKLRRLSSGKFSVQSAVTLDEVEDSLKKDSEKKFILKPEEALVHFNRMYLNEPASAKVLNGAYFTRDQVDQIERRSGDPFLLFDNRHNLLAIVEIDIEKWKINFHTVFNN